MMTTLMDRLLLIVLLDLREKDKECKKKEAFIDVLLCAQGVVQGPLVAVE